MKKSQIFMAAGTVILAISAIFATKANKKFLLNIATAEMSGSANKVVWSSKIFTTKSAVGNVPVYAIVYTQSGAPLSGNHTGAPLVTDLSGGKQLYANPTDF